MAIRIGSAQGYYGDDVLRALPMIEGGHVDVVCFEALAELTMAILQKDRQNAPDRGYTADLHLLASKIMPLALAQGVPLISSGGGLNPLGAAAMIQRTAQSLDLKGLKIAAISGDDVLSRLPALYAANDHFLHLEDGTALPESDLNRIAAANVYLGAQPIVEALRAGAHVIITGRVADPCLYLAPLIAHYGWSWEDWDRLAAGVVCGHLLECTAQVVGGNSLALIDQIDPQDFTRLGYPIAKVEEDGTFTLGKTPGMAGRVTMETVKEQLLYEVHDPRRYLTPDVTVDFTGLSITQTDFDQVRISGARGQPRPEKLKLNLARLEGWTRELIFSISAPRAWDKVAQLRAMIHAAWADLPISRLHIDYLGMNSLYSDAPLPPDPLEVAVRVVFRADNADTLKTAVRRLLSNGLSGPAGMNISGASIGGDPRAVVGLWPTLIERQHVIPHIDYLEVP